MNIIFCDVHMETETDVFLINPEKGTSKRLNTIGPRSTSERIGRILACHRDAIENSDTMEPTKPSNKPFLETKIIFHTHDEGVRFGINAGIARFNAKRVPTCECEKKVNLIGR